MLTRLLVTLALTGAAVVLARRPAAPQPAVTAEQMPRLAPGDREALAAATSLEGR